MNILGQCARAGVLQKAALQARAAAEVKTLRVRTASLAARAGGLSGSNQQKLLLARWLEITQQNVMKFATDVVSRSPSSHGH